MAYYPRGRVNSFLLLYRQFTKLALPLVFGKIMTNENNFYKSIKNKLILNNLNKHFLFKAYKATLNSLIVNAFDKNFKKDFAYFAFGKYNKLVKQQSLEEHINAKDFFNEKEFFQITNIYFDFIESFFRALDEHIKRN